MFRRSFLALLRILLALSLLLAPFFLEAAPSVPRRGAGAAGRR